ncbi:MAG: hypothetical protein JW966_04985 [Anaerolineae bacterium]|nr:hypothetical protein [Anaerolineae bacterium]
MIPVDKPGPDLTISEVLGGNQDDLDDLLSIHQELFPQYLYYQPFMRERATKPPGADPRFVEHWWLLRVDGQAAAIRFFKYIPARDCGFALAIGVLPAFRALTFGRYLRFSHAILIGSMNQLKADAQAAGRPMPVGMGTEIEHYLLWRYYTEYGYVKLPVDYREPSFSQEAEVYIEQNDKKELQFRQIELGILPCNHAHFNPNDSEMLKNVIFALLVDHYELPEDHWVIRHALKSRSAALT